MGCYRCGEPIDSGASFCPNCGLNLDDVRESLRNSTCPKCEASVESDYCVECGLEIDELRRTLLDDETDSNAAAASASDGSGGTAGGPPTDDASSASDEGTAGERAGENDRTTASSGESGQTAVGSSAREQTSAGPEASGQMTAGQEASGQTPTDPEECRQTSTGPEASGQTPTDPEASEQTTAGQEASGQTSAGSEATDPDDGVTTAASVDATDAPTAETAAKGPKKSTYREGLSQDEVFCIDCGTVINRRAEMCPDCGRNQVPPGGWEDDSSDNVGATEKDEKIARKDLNTNVLLGIFLPPIAYVNLGKPLLAVVNLITFNYLLLGFIVVPYHAYAIIRDARERVLDGGAYR